MVFSSNFFRKRKGKEGDTNLRKSFCFVFFHPEEYLSWFPFFEDVRQIVACLKFYSPSHANNFSQKNESKASGQSVFLHFFLLLLLLGLPSPFLLLSLSILVPYNNKKNISRFCKMTTQP